jgi:hypothetical protein
LLAAHLDLAKPMRLLHGEAVPAPAIRREEVHAMAAWDWGPMLAARHLALRALFSLRVDLVFYDLTSTYFEGEGPSVLGAHGHSRDGKPRRRQVLVGVVMIDGWPIAHHSRTWDISLVVSDRLWFRYTQRR